MTVTTDTRRAGPYAGNGVASSFAFVFKVLSRPELRITHTDASDVDTVLTLDAGSGRGYTVSLNADQNANPGGNIVYTVNGVATALPSGQSLTIDGNTEDDQELDLVTGGPFSPQAIEDALDRRTMTQQELRRDVETAEDSALASAASAAGSASAAAASATSASASAITAATEADAAEAAAEGSGNVVFYDSYAAANAAVAGLPANQVVQVFVDENRANRRTIYRKESGVLVFKAYASGPFSGNAGAGAAIRKFPTNGKVVEMGDSNSAGSAGDPMTMNASVQPNPGQPAGSGLLGYAKAPFYGWTGINRAESGNSWNSYAVMAENIIANPATVNTVSTIVADDPDVILIRLGTNDFNSGSNKANWTDAFFRARMAVLINFFLGRTKASIILCLPHPLNWNNGVPSFTQFVSAAEAREVNRIMRDAHKLWEGASDRVEVFNSHGALFGNYCDNGAVDCQDPEGGGSLVNDGLHMTSLGSIRYNEYLVKQIEKYAISHNAGNVVTLPHKVTAATLTDRTYLGGLALAQQAVWSVTMRAVATHLNTYAGDKTIFTFDLGAAWSDIYGGNSLYKGAMRKDRVAEIEAMFYADANTKLARLLGVTPGQTFYAYFHTSGATRTLIQRGTGYGGESFGPANGRNWTNQIMYDGDVFSEVDQVVTFYGTSLSSLPLLNAAAPKFSITLPGANTDVVFYPPNAAQWNSIFTSAVLTVDAPGADGGGTATLSRQAGTTEFGALTTLATFARGNQIQLYGTTYVNPITTNGTNLFRLTRNTGAAKDMVLTLS